MEPESGNPYLNLEQFQGAEAMHRITAIPRRAGLVLGRRIRVDEFAERHPGQADGLVLGLAEVAAVGFAVGLPVGDALVEAHPSPVGTAVGLASAASTFFCGAIATNFAPRTRSTVLSTRLSATRAAPGT